MADRNVKNSTPADTRSWRDELGASATTYDVFRALRRIANAFGYFGFFVMRALEPGASKIDNAIILNSLNPDFVRAFDEMRLLTPSHFLHSLGTALEPEIRLRSRLTADSASGRGQEVIDLLEDFGISALVFMPAQARNGRRGIVGFACDHELIAYSDLYELHHLAVLAHDRLVSLLVPERPEHGLLTERERECILWTAAGKTSVEIAAILGISPHTVDHYITTAGQKLDTVNRAHTVATALRRGLIA